LMLKNYTTNKNYLRTISEIEHKLSQIGARKIMKEYDEDRIVISLSFQVRIDDRDISVKLPARIDRIPAALRHILNHKKITSSQMSIIRRVMKEPERARNIGWRIIQDWLEAQIAVKTLDQINLLEALLPFTVWGKGGQTLYDLIEQSNFDLRNMAKTFMLEYENTED
jgi:hypothetical protein